jgi:predicted MFS family arabinose efflux permease
MVSFGMFGMFFFLSLFMQEILGFSAVGAGIRFLPTTGAIIFTAPLAGRLAGRIGSRIPMTLGLALCGTSLLILHGVTAQSTYGDFWFALPIMGVGMGLTMTPMTAAVMSSVPRQRSGMASATTNTSREVGGVFGIALLGAILTAKMTSALTVSLSALDLPTTVREQIIQRATHGGAGGGGNVPPVVTQAIRSAFVSGMRGSLLVASIALFVGSAVAYTFIRGHGQAAAPDAAKSEDVAAAMA